MAYELSQPPTSVLATAVRSRYRLEYAVLDDDASPLFHDAPFWDALCSEEGIYFGNAALLCSASAVIFNSSQALVALAAGLNAFRLAVSRLDPTVEVPLDITAFVIAVRNLVAIAWTVDIEWSKFEWPVGDLRTPFIPADEEWPNTARSPSRREMAEALPLIEFYEIITVVPGSYAERVDSDYDSDDRDSEDYHDYR
ncbi:hypothetical protein B0H12DRAFT_1232100 [Mycena haematopus]|nr:hypothetical protein B0H12DRAFT_1232100 [Mycena haematopus]